MRRNFKNLVKRECLPLLHAGVLGRSSPSTHSTGAIVLGLNSESHWNVTEEPLPIVRPAR